MRSFWREKTIELGKQYKDVDIFLYSGRRQTAAQNKRRKRRTESSPAQKDLNDARAKRYFIWLAKLNFTYGDLHVTLTYDDRNLPADEDEAKKQLRNWIRRINHMRKKAGLAPVKYLAVTAVYSVDGAPARVHHHVLMSSVADRDALEALWTCGSCNADRIKSFYNSINKLTGYLAKQTSGKKRWSASKGLKQPTSYVVDGKYTPRQMREILEYRAFDPAFWEKKYPGWTILDRDHDIVIRYSDQSGAYIRLQLTRKE